MSDKCPRAREGMVFKKMGMVHTMDYYGLRISNFDAWKDDLKFERWSMSSVVRKMDSQKDSFLP